MKTDSEKAWEVECTLAGYYHVLPLSSGDYPIPAYVGTGRGPDMAQCGYVLQKFVVIQFLGLSVVDGAHPIILPAGLRHRPPCPRCTHTYGIPRGVYMRGLGGDWRHFWVGLPFRTQDEAIDIVSLIP